MQIFIFDRVAEATTNYHSEWWIVVIAKDKEDALKLLSSTAATITDTEWENVVTYELKNNQEPNIFIFPDAGCC